MAAQPVGKIVAVFAVDPAQIGLAGDVRDPDPVLLLQPVAGRKGDAEPLAVEGQHVQAVVECLGLRHAARSSSPCSSICDRPPGTSSTSVISQPGLALRNAARNPMNRAGPIVHMTPSRSSAACMLRKRLVVVLAASASAKSWR